MKWLNKKGGNKLFLIYVLIVIGTFLIISWFVLMCFLKKKNIKVYNGNGVNDEKVYGHSGVDSVKHNNAAMDAAVIVENSTKLLDEKNFDYDSFLNSCNVGKIEYEANE